MSQLKQKATHSYVALPNGRRSQGTFFSGRLSRNQERRLHESRSVYFGRPRAQRAYAPAAVGTPMEWRLSPAFRRQYKKLRHSSRRFLLFPLAHFKCMSYLKPNFFSNCFFFFLFSLFLGRVRICAHGPDRVLNCFSSSLQPFLNSTKVLPFRNLATPPLLVSFFFSFLRGKAREGRLIE